MSTSHLILLAISAPLAPRESSHLAATRASLTNGKAPAASIGREDALASTAAGYWFVSFAL